MEIEEDKRPFVDVKLDAVDAAPKQDKYEVRHKVNKKLKYGLLAFTLFFWLLGVIFCGFGGFIVSQKTGYEQLSDFATDPGIILICLGVAIFIVSSFGVLGSLRENICLLNGYKYLLGVVLAVMVFCGIAAFAFWPETKKLLGESLHFLPSSLFFI